MTIDRGKPQIRSFRPKRDSDQTYPWLKQDFTRSKGKKHLRISIPAKKTFTKYINHLCSQVTA